MISQTPIYNLKVVLRETGIKPDVLRAWERRYGLPQPQRTPGGHRLYSPYDVEMIRWLMARQTEGLTISRAIDLWRERSASGEDPLAVKLPEVTGTLVPDSSIEMLTQNWIGACMAFNETLAEQVLNQALSLYPVEVVCTQMLQRGLRDIGQMWYEGRASVQQEHFSSALAMRRLEALLAAAPWPMRPETIVVACPSDEWHTFTPLLISLFLRRRGWKVVYLGANVPSDQLGESVRAIDPALVVLASQQLVTASSLREISLTLHQMDVPMAFGGHIFNTLPALRDTISGHFLGENVESAIQNIETLVQFPRVRAARRTPGAHYAAALQAFFAQRSQIEARLFQFTPGRNLPVEHIQMASGYLGKEIAAGLALGDISYIVWDMDWIRNMLTQRQMPGDMLYPYLKMYAESIRQVAGAPLEMVSTWLEEYAAQHQPAGN